MRKSLIEVGKIYTDGKGCLRKVTWMDDERWEMEYLQLSGRHAGKIRRVFIGTFAAWARKEHNTYTEEGE